MDKDVYSEGHAEWKTVATEFATQFAAKAFDTDDTKLGNVIWEERMAAKKKALNRATTTLTMEFRQALNTILEQQECSEGEAERFLEKHTATFVKKMEPHLLEVVAII